MRCSIFLFGDFLNKKYLSSAFLLVLSSTIVKVIGAVYKIPLTSYIGAVGRGYFAVAYNLYLPIHAIVLGAFPVALSKLVGKYNSNEGKPILYSLKKASRRVFFFVGIIGMAVMLAMAVPYSKFIVGSPKSIYTILVLAPCVLFSSLASSYLDYYKGIMDMKPTAIAQLLDALFKMIFGLLLAKYSMAYFYNEYLQLGTVLGNYVNNNVEAFGIIYPYTSAFAMLGASLGSFVSLLFAFIYDVINKEKRIEYNKFDVKSARAELLSFSFPIMISCAVQSVFQFLDTASIQYALGKVNSSILQNVFYLANVESSDLSTYAYGIFSTALDFKNLIIGITMSLGVCAVPAISRELELGNNEKLSALVNSIYKYTVLLSLYGGVILSLCSKEILSLFYSNSEDIIVGCSDLVKWFGLTVVFYSLAGTAVNSVQALGYPEKSIKAYVVSGIIRVVLNYFLVQNEKMLLFGAVISGAVGYLVMTAWNIFIVNNSTKIKIELRNLAIKPIFVLGITYYTSDFLYKNINFDFENTTNLLIKIILSSAIFCILCFSLKLLKFNKNFLHRIFKKTA